MKQARASVSFSVDLISCLLSVHMALFLLDGNPRKERAAITGGLSSLATLTTPLMAVMQPDKATVGQRKGWFTFISTKSGQKHFLFVMPALVRAEYELARAWVWSFEWKLTPLFLFLFLNCKVESGQSGFQERECILYWRLCWWVCSQTEWGGESSTAGSAKPCLSPLCPLSTFGHISAMWRCGVVTHSQLKPCLLSLLVSYIPN